MITRRVDLDHVLLDLTLIGFGALLAWAVTGLVGKIAGYLTIRPEPTLRFLLAVIVLVFARHAYRRFRGSTWATHTGRTGIDTSVWETPRSSESVPAPAGDTGDTGVTGSPQPQG
jgi:hypothetical protein